MRSVRVALIVGTGSLCIGNGAMAFVPVLRPASLGRIRPLSTAIKRFSTAMPPSNLPSEPSPAAPAPETPTASVVNEAAAVADEEKKPDLPGDLDELNGFRLGPSVKFWRNWQNDGGAARRIVEIAQQTASSLLSSASSPSGGSVAAKDLLSTQYWAYHILRSGFFASQGVLGSLLTAARSGFSDSSAGSRILTMAQERGDRIVSEALVAYEQDLRHIQDGRYKAPYDMNITHRQFNPLFVLDRSTRFLREAVKTLDRRSKQVPDPIWLRSELYPAYYLNSWHYQTDGWLSSESAKVYETSTETLFIGRQDVMQRHTMLPLASWLEDRGLPRSGEGLQLLEVACGTGRFATFLRDNLPGVAYTGLDLSPFYLQEARDNMRYYETFLRRSRGANATAGLGPVSWLQASADRLPMADESVDVLVCVYLLHETPPDVLPAVAREMGRVLKPGGLLVLTDSIQLGDRATLNPVLGNFEQFNEPHYGSYISTDLGALFREHGGALQPHEKHLCSSTKVLSFTKPAAST